MLDNDIKKILERIESDLNRDREQFSSIDNQLSAIENRLKTLEGRIRPFEDKMADAVRDATSEVIQPVVDDMERAAKTINQVSKKMEGVS